MYYADKDYCYECFEMIEPDCRKKFVDEEEDVTLYFCGNRCLIDCENEQRRRDVIARHRSCNWELGE